MSVHVVHIIDHLGLGGVQTLLVALLPALRAHGYQASVINLRTPTSLSTRLEAAGVPVRSLGLPKWSPRQLPALRNELQHLQPAIVHTHLTVGNSLGRMAAILSGVPAIVMEDQVSVSQDVYSAPPGVVLTARLIEPLLARRTTRYLCPSQLVLDASRVAKRWPAANCRVRYNAVDCARFQPVPDRSAVRAALGLPERPTVATFGRFIPQKRITDVVAIAQALGRQADVQFLIAGDGPEAESIRTAISQAGLADRVLLLGRRTDTEQLLAASEIYLSVSAGEVLSVAILEAMASGCAIVATDAGGTREQVSAGVNGHLAPVGAIPRLSAAVADLLAHPRRRAHMGAASRRIALERFAVPIIADAQAAIYADLVRTSATLAPIR
jgi:glycosyltransferase involved in cell wall biosynthesis